MPESADVHRDTEIHLGLSDNNDHTQRDPTKNSPSQILLEALQNFVIPLIKAAHGKNEKDIGQVDFSLEAGKLVTALQKFISSMIIQSQVGQAIEVDLKALDTSPQDIAMAEFPGEGKNSSALDSEFEEEHAKAAESPGMAPPATENTGSAPGRLEGSELKPSDATLLGRISEAVRERVFSTMPIRLLHFKSAGDSDTKLQITLLDRNGVYGRIIEEIQLNYSEETLRERVDEELLRMRKNLNSYNMSNERSIKDDIIERIVREATSYAILSHTWLRGSDREITYGDWQIGQFDTQQPGYRKLANFCNSARKDYGLSFGWMDTICINKDSSSELDESIRSMYKWYENSAICIIYLAETLILDNIHRDCWFTRGWTLQEMLAPSPTQLVFYNKDWKQFATGTLAHNSKENEDILRQIYKGTTIEQHELFSRKSISISRAMQLAARRTVTRKEDISYSLMGICKVSISIAYGEGAERAFFRLITEILNTGENVIDVFNCAQRNGSIIPRGPSAYLHRFENIGYYLRPNSSMIEPILLTHVGLRIPLLLMPSLSAADPHCQNNSIGDYSATLQLTGSEDLLSAMWNGSYRLLDKGIAKCEEVNVATSQEHQRLTFGVFNFGGNSTTISILNHCLAVCFWPSFTTKWGSNEKVERVGTKQPIGFQLEGPTTNYIISPPWQRQSRTMPLQMHRKIEPRMLPPPPDPQFYAYSLKRSELKKHGMKLTTLYL